MNELLTLMKTTEEEKETFIHLVNIPFVPSESNTCSIKWLILKECMSEWVNVQSCGPQFSFLLCLCLSLSLAFFSFVLAFVSYCKLLYSIEHCPTGFLFFVSFSLSFSPSFAVYCLAIFRSHRLLNHQRPDVLHYIYYIGYI